ncbi:MAG: cation-translocating P-type ATPase [Burkholderiaceae bacterium]|nr:cation-translocating P-type ATPase [Burkholderiaceae bacterium]
MSEDPVGARRQDPEVAAGVAGPNTIGRPDTIGGPNTAGVPGAVGLSRTAATQRLARDGANELPSQGPRGFPEIVLEVLREPMLLLLVGCALLYLFLGDTGEAVLLGVFATMTVGITVVQTRRTERALDALRNLSAPRALVIRDGERIRIPGREVVVGDLIVLGEGDRIPADASLIDASQLSIDESMLSGESVPVGKRPAPDPLSDAAMGRPTGENTPYVFSGTLVVAGQGVARVLATGPSTEMGRIGHSLQSIESEPSPLQRETRRMVVIMGTAAVLLCALVVLALGLVGGRWLDATLSGIALAMSLLPEEFPVVLTVFLAIGAWRMSRHQVLTRRTAAIEALGGASVLCVDKTGTLTENRMTVRTVVAADGERAEVGDGVLPERVHRVVEYALLATRIDPFDPMERAIRDLGVGDHIDAAHLHRQWQMVREYPLSPDLLAMSQVWDDVADGTRVIAAKGAPEAIMRLCHLDEPQAQAWDARIAALADEGLRVLGVAAARLTHEHDRLVAGAPLPGTQHAFEFEWLGLVALVDPVRAGVPAAVQACRSANIRVLMITGDYPGTARAIAAAAGLDHDGEVLTGAEIESLDADALARRLRTTSVVARAVPEHKLRIVRALQTDGAAIAMTGDGVNDAPALRAANIGVAMGRRGTDVAREAADLVIADDDFGSIVRGVRLGRRIYDNIHHAINYVVSMHVAIAGVTVLAVAMGWPLILLPAHIAFLELIIDPACTLVFEGDPENPDLMRRPPRAPDARLFDGRSLARSLAQGALVLVAVAIAYLAGTHMGLAEPAARASVFSMLVLGNLVLILANRSGTRSIAATIRVPNRTLWIVVVTALVALLAVQTVPWLAALFRFDWPGATILAACLAGAVVLAAALEASDRWLFRRTRFA